MTAELLAQNIVAHWMQAAGVAGVAWLGLSVLRLREPGFLLRYWQAVLLVLLLAPWIQPWQPAVAGDFSLSPTTTLTIAAGSTTSTGTVTVTAVDNSVDAPDKTVTVSATVTGGNGVSAPSSQTLTITDDEGAPTVSLVLSPSSVSENGGSSTVTATLSAVSRPRSGGCGPGWK